MTNKPLKELQVGEEGGIPPIFQVWGHPHTEHLSWYSAELVDGQIVRSYGGPMFTK